MTATISTFDYDAVMARRPVIWQERRLHWHCYTWRGSGAQWADDSARHNDASDITPSIIRDWLKKSDRLIRSVYHNPDDAVQWLQEQWEKVRNEALTPIPDWYSDESRLQFAAHDLCSGNDISWGLWIKGPSMVSMSIVGTDGPCHG